MSTLRGTLAITALAVAAACSGGTPDGGDASADTISADSMSADSMTRRQRDSVIGESRLPGAQGVRGALEASDAAAARAAAIDSLSGGS